MKTVHGAMVILVLLSLWCPAATQNSAERLIAANPTDRWMDSGRIDALMTMQRVGESEITLAYSLTYNADHFLFERRLVGGAFPRPKPVKDPNDIEEWIISDEIVISGSPDGQLVHVPGTDAWTKMKNTRFTLDRFFCVSGGVLTDAILEKGTEKIEVDAEGRLVALQVTAKGGELRYTYSDHVQLNNGKWVPRTVTLQGSGDMAWRLEYTEGTPSDEECSLAVPENAVVVSAGSGMQASFGEIKANAIPLVNCPYGPGTRCVEMTPYPTYTVDCCGPEAYCNSHLWETYYHYHKCQGNVWWWEECYPDPFPYIIYIGAQCYWYDERPPICGDDYKCYVMPETTRVGYSSCVCSYE